MWTFGYIYVVRIICNPTNFFILQLKSDLSNLRNSTTIWLLAVLEFPWRWYKQLSISYKIIGNIIDAKMHMVKAYCLIHVFYFRLNSQRFLVLKVV